MLMILSFIFRSLEYRPDHPQLGHWQQALPAVRILVKHTVESDRGGFAGYGTVILGRLELTERER